MAIQEGSKMSYVHVLAAIQREQAAAVPSLAGQVTVNRLPLAVGETYTICDKNGREIDSGQVEKNHVVIEVFCPAELTGAFKNEVDKARRDMWRGEAVSGYD